VHVWFVTPAWRRFAVTRLAFAQRRHLCDELAVRGIAANCVVIADDENIEIAGEFGFPAIEMDNTYLGKKVNAGFRYAAEQGADFVAFCGSDAWMHEDLFDALLIDTQPPIISGHAMAVVDLENARMRNASTRGRYGCPPWFIPRWVLEASQYHPVSGSMTRGLELGIVHGLNCAPEWKFHDPHPLARIDFKSDVNMTPYAAAGNPRAQEVDAWGSLAEHYPQHLIALAMKTHLNQPELVTA